jgi:hypothetical protein
MIEGIAVESDFRNKTTDVLVKNGSEEVVFLVRGIHSFGDEVEVTEQNLIQQEEPEIEDKIEDIGAEPYWNRY